MISLFYQYILNIEQASSAFGEPDITTFELLIEEYQGYFRELRQYAVV